MEHTSTGKDHPKAGKAAMFLGLKPGFPMIAKYTFDLYNSNISKRVKTKGSHEMGNCWAG